MCGPRILEVQPALTNIWELYGKCMGSVWGVYGKEVTHLSLSLGLACASFPRRKAGDAALELFAELWPLSWLDLGTANPFSLYSSCKPSEDCARDEVEVWADERLEEGLELEFGKGNLLLSLKLLSLKPSRSEPVSVLGGRRRVNPDMNTQKR